MRIACLSDAVRIGIGAFAGAGLLLTTSGCLATRSWVNDQLRPITGQQEKLETQVNNLHLERKLVLDSSTGPTFASGSAALVRTLSARSMHSSEIWRDRPAPSRPQRRIASS